MKFRHHRGSLEESMSTTIEISSIEELQMEISDHGAFSLKDVSQITFRYACMDDRTGWGWNSYYVCVDGKCVGISDGIFKEK